MKKKIKMFKITLVPWILDKLLTFQLNVCVYICEIIYIIIYNIYIKCVLPVTQLWGEGIEIYNYIVKLLIGILNPSVIKNLLITCI